MSDEIKATVQGIPDFREALLSIPHKLRRRALRNALAKAARVAIRDPIIRKTPMLTMENAMRAPFRKPGTLRKAIAVRTSKLARQAGDVGVFVNVRPAKGGARGAKSPDDPYYWRWVNFEHRSRSGNLIPGVHFLEEGARHLGEALAIFTKEIGPQIQKLDTNPKDDL